MNKKLKFIVIIIDAIVLFFLGYSYSVWLNRNNELLIENNEYSFRNFNYSIPNNLNYIVIDEKKFKLESKDWYAVVEVFIDKNNYISKYSDLYYKAIMDNDFKVDEPKKIHVNDKEVVVYNKYDNSNNSVLCYFSTESPFAFEVEIFNKDNSFNIDNLEYIMKILLKAKYDNRSGNKYEYFSTDYLDDISKEAPVG